MTNLEINLLTVPGIAGVVALVVQFLIKPFLTEYEKESWYGAIVNLCAAALGLLLALGGAWAAGVPLGNGAVVTVIVLGVVAGLTGVGGYEVAKNILAASGG